GYARQARKRRCLALKITNPAGTPRQSRQFGKQIQIPQTGSQSLPAIPRPPWTPPRISTASRSKSPRCARIAAGAIRPTANEPPDRLSRATIEGRPAQRRGAPPFWGGGGLPHVGRYWVEIEEGGAGARRA